MKNTIKFAALGACALAASSTASLAGALLPAGITTGLALGAPLPEGVYDITIGSYGSNSAGISGVNLAYAVPVWLIWSTPWSIAGGRIQLDTATGVANIWTTTYGSTTYPFGTDSWLNTLLDTAIKWNLGNGWNFGLQAGVWLPSDQNLALGLGRNYASFQGVASVSYVKNGWNLTATGIYGSAGDRDHTNSNIGDNYDNWQPSWFNLDLTATRKYGKLEVGTIAYGSWDLEMKNTSGCVTCVKEASFAIGSLVGYDFGSFVAQAKLSTEVMHQYDWIYTGETTNVAKEVRGTVTIIKPLWNPQADAPLK
jgi:hypothetical protein